MNVHDHGYYSLSIIIIYMRAAFCESTAQPHIGLHWIWNRTIRLESTERLQGTAAPLIIIIMIKDFFLSSALHWNSLNWLRIDSLCFRLYDLLFNLFQFIVEIENCRFFFSLFSICFFFFYFSGLSVAHLLLLLQIEWMASVYIFSRTLNHRMLIDRMPDANHEWNRFYFF